jgi:putative transposase
MVVMRHERRHVVHFNVTEHPTAEWAARQIREAFPFDEAPRFLIHDNDSIFTAAAFQDCLKSLGIESVKTAWQSPWQNPYCERLIGSIRRDCLDHVIVLGERHLKRILASYFDYYHSARAHMSLDRNAPVPRPIEPPDLGAVVAIPHLGGLHHRYTRCPAA